MSACAYCGRRPCECGADLARIEQAMRGDTHRKPRTPDFRATCPRCGELASPRAFTCPACGTALYLPKHDPLYKSPGART